MSREFNVQDQGAGDVATVPDSTQAFEKAGQLAYAAGGGEVVAPAVPNGYALRRLLSGAYAQKGGGIRLRPRVSLRGDGTKLLLRDNCDFITIASPRNQSAAVLTITADVHYGDRTVAVDVTRPVGTRVFLRCGMSGFETAEPRHFGFAAIVAIPDATHVTLDRPILADLTVATTGASNRALVVLDEVVEGIKIEGFDLINDMQGGANAESGVSLTMGRHIEVDRLSGINPGAGLLSGQFCDEISASHIDCRGSARQNGQLSKGRVVGFAESTNAEIDGVSGENFEGAFMFNEFFCENVQFRNVKIANTFIGRDNAHTALLFNQASAMSIDGLELTGDASYLCGDGGVGATWGLPATCQFRNVSARVKGAFIWPSTAKVDGYLRVSTSDRWN